MVGAELEKRVQVKGNGGGTSSSLSEATNSTLTYLEASPPGEKALKCTGRGKPAGMGWGKLERPSVIKKKGGG